MIISANLRTDNFFMKTHSFLLAIAGFAYLAFNTSAAVLYVDLKSANPAPPYADWSTAATTIQVAIDACSDGDQILVTNGVYQTGGRVVYGSLTNRVAINKAVTLFSVNGPLVTVIQGSSPTGESAVRCVYMTNGTALIGFTLTNGATRSSGDEEKEQSGGGVWCESSDAVVFNCVIAGNSANRQGGGAMRGTLFDCVLSSNMVPLSFDGYFPQGSGGGAQSSALNNCLLAGNYASDAGGGADGGVLTGCVLAGNSVNDSGGAAASATLNQCIVTNNSAGSGGGGVESCVLNGCSVDGNFSFYGGGASDSTLTNCTLAANSGNSGGGALNSTLIACTLSGNSTYDSEIAGTGGGANSCTLNNCWLFNNSSTYGGGAIGGAMNNCLLASNSAFFNGGGVYSVFLTNCTLSGNTAYYGGGAESSTLQSCVLSSNAAALNGGGADSSILNQCTLSGNSASFGGGAGDSTLISCTLSNNFAVLFDYEGGQGGGADYCYLADCLLTGNSADYIGGGADSSTLNNCTLAGNSANISGGGASISLLNNCIVYFNTAPDGPNFAPSTEYYPGCTLKYCCTTPMPDDGVYNFTNAPLVVDPIGGDFHLQSGSPCINAGNNAFVTLTNDLDGNPRIVGGTVDIGTYEYQNPTSVISYAWLQYYGLPTDGSADFIDSDGDGMNNWQEWRTGTNPTDASSLLKMTTVTNDVSGMTITWQSVSGVTYFLQRATDLGTQPAFSTIQTGIAGQPGTTSYTDTDATGAGPYYYRVGVQ